MIKKLILIALFSFIPFISLQAETPMIDNTQYETAILAGGCFWCIESDFDSVDGVIETTSGYTGGTTTNPTYKQISSQPSGHYEGLRVVFDPAIVSYKEILQRFWITIDPFNADGQFCDKGPQYRAAVFYLDEAQKEEAIKSRDATQKLFKEKIVTEILEAKIFYDAEDYHQDYHNKNPIRYKFYRGRCGRDARVNAIWESVK